MSWGSVDEVMGALEEIGWFEGRDGDSRADVRKKLGDCQELTPNELPDALADFSFDTECIDGNPGDYADIIKEFAHAARSAFAIDDVSDNFVEGAASVAFRVGDVPYSLTVPFESDWWDPQVSELLDKVAAEHGDERRFVLLPVLDQVAYVAFLKPSTFEAALKRGLLASFQDLAAEYM
jgi:hypothetical protein